jgi:chorismate mutase
MRCTTQDVNEESQYMTSNVIDMQQQQQSEQDERLLCIRILNVDSDEVHTNISHYYISSVMVKLSAMCSRSTLLLTLLTSLYTLYWCAPRYST